MTDSSRNSLQTAWQNIVDSAAAMLKSLLSRGEFYDVMFRVGTAGQTEDIKAHRALLATRSPVFAAMFYGSLPEKGTVVEINDVAPDIFRMMLKYLYSDCSADITSGNVVNMYRVADKYDILPLRLVCAGKVGECASMNNIGDLLVMNEVYEDELVAAHCLAFIKTNAWQLFQKEEYYVDLSQNHLIYIWKHDTEFKGSNKLPEVDIYTGAGKWAKAECERQDISGDDSTNQRLVLGGAFDLLSFGRMSLDDFQSIALRLQDSLLTWEETARMTFYMANAKNSVLPFGQPALPRNLQDRELIRRSDGNLVEVQLGLLEYAVAGKITCGCDCSGPQLRRQCAVRAKCRCNCNSSVYYGRPG